MVFIWKSGNKVVNTLKVPVLECIKLLHYNHKKPDMVFLTRHEVDLIIDDTGRLEQEELDRANIRRGEVGLDDLTPRPNGQKLKLYFDDYWTALNKAIGQEGRMVLTNDHQPVTVQDSIKVAVEALSQPKPGYQGISARRNKSFAELV